MFRSLLSGTHQLKSVKKRAEFPVDLIEVEVDTLDDLVQKLCIDRIEFLKIDVEGAELQVLKGAKKTLKITRNIAMELHYENEAEEVSDFLGKRGFQVKVIGSYLYAKNNNLN